MTNETRRWEDRQEITARCRLGSRFSASARSHMNAVIRKNLTDALAVDANDVDTASDTSGALGDGRDRARFCRTIVTCIWGVSDHPNKARDRVRGVAEGVAHTPDVSVTAPDSRAPTARRAAKSAAPIDRGEVADHKKHRHFTD
jgi:hypothetical protein